MIGFLQYLGSDIPEGAYRRVLARLGVNDAVFRQNALVEQRLLPHA